MSATATRRAALAALAGSVAFAGTIGAAIAAPAAAAAIPDEPEGDRFEAGRREGEEIALLYTARAWVDRWKAAGGDFAVMWPAGGGKGTLMFGHCEPRIWQPSDKEEGELAPYLCLTEPEHQAGAIRALEALLVLVPGLRAAVRDVIGAEAIEREA